MVNGAFSGILQGVVAIGAVICLIAAIYNFGKAIFRGTGARIGEAFGRAGGAISEGEVGGAIAEMLPASVRRGYREVRGRTNEERQSARIALQTEVNALNQIQEKGNRLNAIRNIVLTHKITEESKAQLKPHFDEIKRLFTLDDQIIETVRGNIYKLAGFLSTDLKQMTTAIERHTQLGDLQDKIKATIAAQLQIINKINELLNAYDGQRRKSFNHIVTTINSFKPKNEEEFNANISKAISSIGIQNNIMQQIFYLNQQLLKPQEDRAMLAELIERAVTQH